MDFPQFFRTGLQNLRIKSDRWRGLAVLCKQPETVQSYRGIAEDNVLGVTGSGFTNRMVAAMVMLPHMKSVAAVISTPANVLLPAQPGIRYLIYAYSYSYVVTAIGTTLSIEMDATINGVATTRFIHYPVPLTAAAYSGSGVMSLVTDVNTAVTALALVQTPSFGVFIVYYAEIGAS